MLKNTVIISFLIILLISAFACEILAESLWTPGKSQAMYSDKRACKVGDILTIIIIESAASSQAATTDASKDTKLESPVGAGPLIESIPLFQFGNSDSMKAAGTTSRSSTLTAKITVRVNKIDDNGNLQIEGTRDVQTNKEKAQIKLTGLVRPQDVASDNTVMSTYIADAKILYEGKGVIGSRQREGIVSKLLKILF